MEEFAQTIMILISMKMIFFSMLIFFHLNVIG